MADLLFLSQRLPYPPTKGEKIRAYHELTYLARHYDVHLGCLADDPADIAHAAALKPLCRDIHVAPLDPRFARLTCLSGLLTHEGLSVTYFRDRSLSAWVRRVMQTVRPAMTFVYSSNMAPYVLDLPRTGRFIADIVDVDSAKWRTMAEAERGPMRLVYRREWRRIEALEERIVRDADMSVLVSDAEAALLARRVPAASDRIGAVSNGVDHRYFDPAGFPGPQPNEPPEFVFTGTMDYKPNADAVAWFATEILPLIRAAIPAARFTIVGANPSRQTQALGELDGITVTGRVPDVRPWLARAVASVAPMRIARGIQNKVLEAMAMARPVVLTPDALEGITATPGQEVILADTARAFADACIGVVQRSDASAIGIAARTRVLHDYDWDACLARYDDMLRPAGMPNSSMVESRLKVHP
ncbi:MAG TPA: TIGR03087 family PEP-CTERM/XrtA system glycosyltransferase [Rhodopila sp.]|nr:TIGR03087 family PEP-CTERM/XrtA system glycosyltransferase [Rhodopila sp.]